MNDILPDAYTAVCWSLLQVSVDHLARSINVISSWNVHWMQLWAKIGSVFLWSASKLLWKWDAWKSTADTIASDANSLIITALMSESVLSKSELLSTIAPLFLPSCSITIHRLWSLPIWKGSCASKIKEYFPFWLYPKLGICQLLPFSSHDSHFFAVQRQILLVIPCIGLCL